MLTWRPLQIAALGTALLTSLASPVSAQENSYEVILVQNTLDQDVPAHGLAFGSIPSYDRAAYFSASVVDTRAMSLVGSGWFDTSNRSTVIAAYDAEFSQADPSVGWSGDLASCDSGGTSQQSRAATVQRINYYRAMAGVPAVIEEDAALSAKAQSIALVNAAEVERRRTNGQSSSIASVLNHNLPSSHACYSGVAAEAAQSSNLYLGRIGSRAIDGYMMDPGAGNSSAGHRSWILHPPSTKVGVGDVPAPPGGYGANALYVIADEVFASQPTLRQGSGQVAWPSAGYIPGQLVSDRWSFSIRGADFNGASVQIKKGSATIPLEIEHRSAGGGAPFASMVWAPKAGSIDTSPATDQAYVVTVSGVVLNGATRTFTYTVTVIGDKAGVVSANASQEPGLAKCGPEATYLWDPSSQDLNPQRLEILRLYCAGLGRYPDAGGLRFWVGQASDGLSLERVAEFHLDSPEWRKLDVGTQEKFVTVLYQNVLGRNPDKGGFNFWTGMLNGGHKSRAKVLLDFSESAEHRTRTRTG